MRRLFAPHRPTSTRLGRPAVAFCVAGLVAACTAPSAPSTTSAPSTMSSGPAMSTGAASTSSTPSFATPAPSAPSARASAGAAATGAPVVAPAAAPGQRVRLLGPVEDAPGALVALVATVPGAPRGYGVRFALDVPGGSASCEGPTWVHAGGLSQRCWVTLPRTGTDVVVQAKAQFVAAESTVSATPGASQASIAPARGRVRVALRGPATAPVDAATRDKIERCDTPGDVVRLSFDDGFLDAAHMTRMLGALEAANVRAWFFPTQGWASEHPDLMRQLRASGHYIGSHTVTHPFLNRLGDAQLAREVSGGPRPVGPLQLVRPGFGAGAYTQRVGDAARAAGLSVCYWSTDTRDWAGRSGAEITSAVLNGDEFSAPARAGGMILGHMTGRHTSEAIPGLVAGLRREGLRLEPLH